MNFIKNVVGFLTLLTTLIVTVQQLREAFRSMKKHHRTDDGKRAAA